MSADRMPASRGITRLADIPDGECRDGGPDLVIRGEQPWLASRQQGHPWPLPPGAVGAKADVWLDRHASLRLAGARASAAAFLEQVKKVVNDPNVEVAYAQRDVRACDGVALVGQRLRATVGHADGEARRTPKERRKAGTCGAGAANRSPAPSIASP